MQNPNEDTEWNDILRAKGILPPKEPTLDEQQEAELNALLEVEAAKPRTKTTGRPWAELTAEELDELEDDEDDQVLESYRQQRMAEMKRKAANARYGTMIDITAEDYKREVNHAGENVWVVVFLYKNELLVCRRLQQILKQLAAKFPGTKFVQSISSNCIPNYPDRNLPSIFIYHNDDMKKQFVGPSIFGGESMTAECVEWALSEAGAIETDLEEDPRARQLSDALGRLKAQNRDEDGDED